MMLGALVKITVSGTEVEIYIKPDTTAPTPGLSVTVSPLNVVTVTVSSNGKKVTISSPDECLYLYIDLKTITVAPKYILNLKSRVLKDLPIIGSNGGYCGAEPPNTASVTDSSNWLFTPEQHQELCDLCSAGGAQITPPGCGPAPPATDPVGLPRCSFADAIVADDNVIRWECTGTVQARMVGKSDPESEILEGVFSNFSLFRVPGFHWNSVRTGPRPIWARGSPVAMNVCSATKRPRLARE